ncbi:uncharacterized protein LOC131245187 isoform X2 [Magnolia sinica]|uniref:uncharacterized protein LOC131245187 isoform X2 n=1 Tax=Magnolia sinica TaxID=86752 RepID=UPI0026597DA9|nr:uncharacterized protein LOC131245187 isoform X2 [Magnolia sinica]
METLSVRPLSISSISNLPNPRIQFPSSLFKFNSKKPRNTPNPNTLKTRCDYNPPTESLLHTIRDFVLSRKWVSRVRDSVKSEFPKDGEFLQSGGIGMTLLSTTTAAARVHISPFLATLAANPTFVSGLLAWALAQTMKVLLNFFVDRKWDLRILFSSGGMPSSHSALCMALTTSVALCHGVGDSLFPVCLGFSLIVMYDATGVRRHAGMQAEPKEA